MLHISPPLPVLVLSLFGSCVKVWAAFFASSIDIRFVPWLRLWEKRPVLWIAPQQSCALCSWNALLQSDAAPHTLIHLEFRDWPDFGVPSSTAPVREMMKSLHCVPANAGPYVVHCRYVSNLALGTPVQRDIDFRLWNKIENMSESKRKETRESEFEGDFK